MESALIALDIRERHDALAGYFWEDWNGEGSPARPDPWGAVETAWRHFVVPDSELIRDDGTGYRIDPRPEEFGGGWNLRLFEHREDAGGGAYPLCAYDGDPAAAYDDAVAEGHAWLESRPLAFQSAVGGAF